MGNSSGSVKTEDILDIVLKDYEDDKILRQGDLKPELLKTETECPDTMGVSKLIVLMFGYGTDYVFGICFYFIDLPYARTV